MERRTKVRTENNKADRVGERDQHTEEGGEGEKQELILLLWRRFSIGADRVVM